MSEKSAKEPVRLKRFMIEGLFGEDAPPIDIEFKLEDRVTVLHGPNGSGKTIALGLIEAVRNDWYADVLAIPFGSIVIELTNGASARLTRIEPQSDRIDVEVHDKNGRREDSIYTIFDRTDGARVGFTTDWGVWSAFSGSLPRVKLIGINRLLSMRAIDIEPALMRVMQSLGGDDALDPEDQLYTRKAAVERFGQDIKAEVERANQAHLRLTAQLDATLAQRLITRAPTAELSVLSAQYDSIHAREQRLIELGLLQEAPVNGIGDAITEENAHIFATVLGDRQKRLDVYQVLADKAQRIVTSLSKKFQRKTVRIDAETGYHVTSASGRSIDLALLSSGEQHELIMMHELLFDIEPGTLLLIDEPELSLHPVWQLEVLPEMLEIAKLSQLDVVMATHSPYIADRRHDLMVQIGGPTS